MHTREKLENAAVTEVLCSKEKYCLHDQ